MKKWDELTPEQQQNAVEHERQMVLQAVCEGVELFTAPEVKARIKKAAKKAEQMQTPWFVGEYIMEEIAGEIEAVAQHEAKRALYAEGDEYVIYLSRLENIGGLDGS